MRIIGVFATLFGLLLAAVGVALFVQSLPEIQRYLKIRSM
jgi:hypothetical protein